MKSRSRSSARRILGALTACALALGMGPLVGSAAAATPELDNTSPANGSSVSAPPARITVTFKQAISGGPLAQLHVINNAGGPVGGTVTTEGTPLNTIVFTPTSAASMTAGAYTAAYEAFGNPLNSPPATGTFAFTITGGGPAPTPLAFDEAASDPQPSETVTPPAEVVAAYNKPLLPTSNITVWDPQDNPVAGTPTVTGNKVVFTPAAGPAAFGNGEHTVRVTAFSNVESPEADANREYSFTVTGATPAEGPKSPVLQPSQSSPQPGSTGPAPDKIKATYDIALDKDSTAGSKITVTGPSGPVLGQTSFENDDRTIVLDPTAATLAAGEYRVVVEARSTTSPSLVSVDQYAFTVAAAATGALTFDPAASDPQPNETVTPPAEVVAAYNMPLHAALSQITVRDPRNAPVQGTTTFRGNSIVFTPDDGPAAFGNGVHTVRVVAVSATNPEKQDANREYTFTVTGAPPGEVPSPPAFQPSQSSPAPSSTGPAPSKVTATYDVALDTDATTGSKIVVVNASGQQIAGTTSFENQDRSIVLTPNSTLPAGEYRVVVEAKSTSVPPLVTPTQYAFTVSPTPADTTPPALVGTFPADGTTSPPRSSVSASYGENLQAAPNSAIRLWAGDGATEVTGTSTLGGDSRTITFTTSGGANLAEAGNPYKAEATAKDAAGNTTTTTWRFSIDGTGPAIASVTMTDPVNDTNKTAVTVSGSTEADATLSISVDDADGTTSAVSTTTPPVVRADSSGAFSATLNLQSLTDGPLTATVTATDSHGNAGPAGLANAVKDTLLPVVSSVTISPNPVNASTAGAVTVGGSTDAANRPVRISIDDADNGETHPLVTTVTSDASGAYSSGPLGVEGFADGVLTARVTVTDAADNVSAEVTGTANKDTGAPALSPITVEPSPVNVSTGPSVTVRGTTEAGFQVLVVARDGGTGSVSATPTADGSGDFTAPLDLTALADGTVTVTATVADTAGNSVTRTVTTAKDLTPPEPPGVVVPAYANAGNHDEFPVSGSADRDSVVTIRFSDGNAAHDEVVNAPTSESGDYQTTADLSGLDEGDVTVTAMVRDPGGNVSSVVSRTVFKDTLVLAPTVQLADPITRLTAGAVSVTGRTEPGNAVSVRVEDPAGGTVTGPATVDASTGDYTATLDLRELADGTLTAYARATDAAGNVSDATVDTATKITSQALTLSDLPAAPVSGTAYTVRVTAHQTHEAASPVDDSYTGTPALSAIGDDHFAGSCGAAVDGVATCTGVTFGDLGAATLRAAEGNRTGSQAVVVQPTALRFSPAPPSVLRVGTAAALTVVPVAGVSGASISDYTATRTLSVTGGGSSPASGTALACPAGSCTFSLTFATGGSKLVRVQDSGSPSLSTPTATIAAQHPTTLSLRTSATTIDSGQAVTVSGKLARKVDGAGIGAQAVRIYGKVAPETAYRLLRTVTTTSTGTWSAGIVLPRNTVFQAVHPANASTEQASSATAKVAVRTRVVVRSPASGSTVSYGSALRVTGYTSPAQPGTPVYLVWRRSNGSTATLQKVVVARNGTFAFSRSGLARGSYTLYVLIGATSTNTGGRSAAFTVRIA